MGPTTRQQFAHLEQIQNQNEQGKRRKKRKRDHRRMWVEADQAFHKARASLNVTQEIKRLIAHPDLKKELSKEQLNTVAMKAKEIAVNTRQQIDKLSAIRDEHIVVRAKYPSVQRRYAPMDEVMDNLGIMEGYTTWTEETLKLVILPCAELTETIENTDLDLAELSVTESESND